MNADHVLVIGFGGPTTRDEVKPFLLEVARGRSLGPGRLREVARHYDAIGGSSPYHDRVIHFSETLEKRLRKANINLPVFVGMRNWHPFLKDALVQIKQRGGQKGIGLVLAPHRSPASFDRYVDDVTRAGTRSEKNVKFFPNSTPRIGASARSGAEDIAYEYVNAWHDHPLWIRAQVEEIQKIVQTMTAEDAPGLPGVSGAVPARGFIPRAGGRAKRGPLTQEERNATHVVFTAHSIPTAMAKRCRYEDDVRLSCELTANAFQGMSWSTAYQSRSGNPNEPWLGPDVVSTIPKLAAEGIQTILVVPIGFMCDNAEVLYDLDIEVRQAVEKKNLHYRRTATVLENENVIRMFVELISDKIYSGQPRAIHRGL
ncbi:MAG: hypothetical protein A3A73_00950 [Omnitrophica bacterium RIFCSPLOWO2_01_FULL_50_24]|nr:MAG: hypothetical protein A3A73_00950 [Omnitrophica bacterium RIFCSPLOWO2_01_FULL_50_24]